MTEKGEQTLADWLEEVPERAVRNLRIYEAERRETPPEVARQLAKRFDLDGEIESHEDLHLIRQGKRVLVTYRKSGAFLFGDFARLYHPDYEPELPDEDEAREIAVSFLRENEWWPEGAVLAGVERGEFERAEGREREKRSVQANHICVHFRFSLDSIETYGPGAKVKVYVGHGGEVIGLFHAARKLHPYAEFAPLSRGELEEVLSRKLGIPLRGILLRQAMLAYMAESPVLDSRFVQPVYVFSLAAPVRNTRDGRTTVLEFETHPIPATGFAPNVVIDGPRGPRDVGQGDTLSLSCSVVGGKGPFKYTWESNVDGLLGDERALRLPKLSIAHRERRLTSHTVKVTVTDAHGNRDSHQICVKVHPEEGAPELASETPSTERDPGDPYVGVEWCNLYHGSAPDISGTDGSAQGFKNAMQALPNWSSRFDYGNDWAWEQDFKFATAPGGGTDTYYADNVDFAWFAGHGSSGSFWFGSTIDDHEMRAADARWGDGVLNWIVLHACQTMRNNFAWTVWCDAFEGLHQMFGFHTNTEGSNPSLGARFAFWASFRILPWMDAFDLQTAWEIACSECFDSGRQYAVIYAGQTGTDTHNDHLPGYGHVSADPTSPYIWSYYKGTC